jgi:adenylate cyclase
MESTQVRRRLKAILLADVVGYSRLMSLDEEDTHARLADYVKSLIEPKIAENLGRLIRSMGDGLLVEFDSAVDAVHCGLDIQSMLAERNAGVDKDRRIQLRIGINTGDVIVDERDIYGNSVNIAARLEGLAEPGEVYITRAVRDQLQGHPTLLCEDKGERRVKNIPGLIRVYRVRRQSDRLEKTALGGLIRFRRFFDGAVPRLKTGDIILTAVVLVFVVAVSAVNLPNWREGSRLPLRASILVLPFSNLSNDPTEDYFADAVTDDLTTDLSRLPGTFVIARATAFTYKGKAVDARRIGQECSVRYLLEGSIKRAKTRVQTNARLVDAESALQIWSDRFDNEVSNLFELQEAITGRIAAALDIQLVQAESRRAIARQAVDPDAVDLRLRAMGLYISGITPENTLAARRLLQEAVRKDPGSGEAWAWLADLVASDYLNRWNDANKQQLDEAAAAVERALAIDETLALAHFANGLVRRAKGEHELALNAFGQALNFNPNFARAYAQQAAQLVNVGRPNEAPPLVEKAIKLSPRDPSLGVFYWILGRAAFFSTDYNEAVTALKKSVELRKNLWYNRLYLASAHALIGNLDQAHKVLSEFDNQPQFRGYTLARVEAEERANPNANSVVVAGREKFREGLLKAGMAVQ